MIYVVHNPAASVYSTAQRVQKLHLKPAISCAPAFCRPALGSHFVMLSPVGIRLAPFLKISTEFLFVALVILFLFEALVLSVFRPPNLVIFPCPLFNVWTDSVCLKPLLMLFYVLVIPEPVLVFIPNPARLIFDGALCFISHPLLAGYPLLDSPPPNEPVKHKARLLVHKATR